MAEAEYLYVDPVGNRLTVEALTSSAVVIRIVADDGDEAQEASVIITPGALQAAADAARRSAGQDPAAIFVVRPGTPAPYEISRG